MSKKVICFAILLVLGGCSNVNNQDVGTITGGALGGLLGSQFGKGEGRVAATAVGVLAGAIIGGRIGQYMDKVDRMQVARTLENTPTNRTRSWTNPDTNARYSVTPNRTYYRENGSRPCREYTTEAVIGGQKEKIYGTACRMDDGSWKVMR